MKYPVTIQLPTREVTLMVDEDDYILEAILEASIEEVPYVCYQGWCLACAAHLIEGEVDVSDAYMYFPEDRTAGFILLCSAKPRSPLTIQIDPQKTRREMLQHRLDKDLPVRSWPKPHWGRGTERKKRSTKHLPDDS